jgi:hypothetical protein
VKNAGAEGIVRAAGKTVTAIPEKLYNDSGIPWRMNPVFVE